MYHSLLSSVLDSAAQVAAASGMKVVLANGNVHIIRAPVVSANDILADCAQALKITPTMMR